MDLVGKLLCNRYEVIEKIGDGGMATVYKSRDKILNRKVAIKVLKDEYSNDQEFIKRFQIEAQSAASLSHPNIVSIYDVANENNIHYIVMELIEGKTLKELIRENKKIDWREAVEFASQIASGLAQAHKNHIIHRDIKPHNIIVTKDGVAKITDFGIAKAVTSSTINASGSTLGSVHYFSPEHARGGYTDEKSDIYSLGVVLYEMITGKVPFQSDTPVSVALKHLQEKPVPPIETAKDMPMGLNDIILKAMQKEVSERYSSASEMYSDLQKILKSPSTLNVGGIKNMDDKNFATQKVPVIGASTRKSTAESNKDYMAKSKKKKPTKKQILIRRLIYLFIAIGIVVLSAFLTTQVINGAFGDMFKENDDVEVPNLYDMHKDKAKEELEKLGLKMFIEAEVTSTTIEKDHIVSQTYNEGYRLKEGATVNVKVSKGAKKVNVPNISKMSLEAARIEIENHNLKLEIKEEASSEVAKGDIIRQEPLFNVEVDEGDTVTIYISTGAPDGMVLVPDVMLYDEEMAKEVLDNAKLRPVIKYAEKLTEPEGKILSQTPEKDAIVSELSEVTVVINKYEIKEPENTETPDNNNENNQSSNNGNNNQEDENAEVLRINLSNKGARDTFSVRVELLGDVSGKKILYEAAHRRSDGFINVPLPKGASGLIKVYIDNEFDSEMPI